MRPSLPLARLALQRALPPAAVLLLVAAALLVAGARWEPPAELAPLLQGATGSGGSAALARQGMWSALLALVAPLLVAGAAAVVPHWRRGEVLWLQASPASRLELFASTWAGLAAASALALALVLAAAELSSGSEGAAWQRSRAVPAPDVVLAPYEARVDFAFDPGGAAPGALLRLHVHRLSGAAGGSVRLTVEREGVEHATEVALAGRASLTLPMPPGEGPVRASLAREGEAALVLEGAAEVLVPARTPRIASAVLAVRAWLSLCAWCALALGLGAWVSAPLAALLVASATLLSWLRASEVPLPWIDLPEALRIAGEGIAPAWSGWRALASTLLLVLSGALAFASGLRGRATP